ncbi:MAG: hypothetical protein QXF26_01105 [Candidatus Bathyarchaeia archaeon]
MLPDTESWRQTTRAGIYTTSDCLIWVAQVLEVNALPLVSPVDEIPEWTVFVGGTVASSSVIWAALPLIFSAMLLAAILSRGALKRFRH